MTKCASCSKSNATKTCSACKSVSYCNIKCQRNHWKTHKKKCKLLSKRNSKAKSKPQKDDDGGHEEIEAGNKGLLEEIKKYQVMKTDPNREHAYIHRQKQEVPTDNLYNGIHASLSQIGDGVGDPLHGVVDGLWTLGSGYPIAGIKQIASKSITGVQKIATAPKLITNGLFNSILPNDEKNNEDEKIHILAVKFTLRDESDFVDNKILGIKSGDGWPENEQNNQVLLRHDDKASVIVVDINQEIEPTHIGSGLAGGGKKIVGSVFRPLMGVKDIFYKPYECYQKEKSYWSIPKGFLMGLRNTVESPFLVIGDALGGTKDIVEGVFNTPQAAANQYNGLRFNTWMGWIKGYKIQDLKAFPGKPGDMLCIHQTTYSHVMIKIDDEHVVHRSGDANIMSGGSSMVEIREVCAGIMKNTLQQIKTDYGNHYITVVDADYCINKNKNDGKYLVYKKRAEHDIIKMANECIKMNSGWELFGKNCEHFCFNILYGVDVSIQIQKYFSLNQ
eukprot:72922_1